MTAGTHVVFGTGPAGRAVAAALVSQGARVRMINRSGTAAIGGVETIGGDATDPGSPAMSPPTPTPSTSASTPPTTTAGPTSSRRSSAPCSAPPAGGREARRPREPLHVRPYGWCADDRVDTGQPEQPQEPDPGRDVRRAPRRTPTRATSRSSSGAPRTSSGRVCADSAMGEFVFGPALAGKRAQTMGRPDTRHTYSYVPDIGRNLVLLGQSRRCLRPCVAPPEPNDPHHPRDHHRRVRGGGMNRHATSHPQAADAAVVGLFNRNVRELLHTYYQFDAPFVVDDSAFRHAFGGHITDWHEIVATTVDWYRARRPHPTSPPTSDRPQP